MSTYQRPFCQDLQSNKSKPAQVLERGGQELSALL